MDKVKRYLPNTSKLQLASELGFPRKTLCRWINEEDQLRSEAVGGHLSVSKKRKRGGKDNEVDEALVDWFNMLREKKKKL